MVVASHVIPMERKCIPGASPYLAWFRPIGFGGVDLFFVISGFVIVTSTWSSFARPRIALNFILRRAARIFPVYWVMLMPIVLLDVFFPHFVDSTQSVRPSIVASFLLLPQQGLPLLTVSWSLVFETYFYYIYTIAIRLPIAKLPLVIGTWMTFTLVVFTFFPATHVPLLVQLGDTITFEFAYGMLIGWWLVTKREFRASAPAIALGICAIVVNGLLSGAHEEPGHGQLRSLAIALPMAAILYGFIGLETQKHLVAGGRMVLLGDASYSLYLWHVPVLEVVTLLSVQRAFLRNPVAHAVWIVASVAVVIALSLLAYQTIEKPLVRYFGGLLRLKSPGTILPNVSAI